MSVKVKENVLFSILGGIALATMYTVFLLVLFLLRGPRLVDQYGVSLVQMIGGYYGGGVVGGLVVGLLLPLTRWLVGAAFVGYVAAVPFFLYGSLMMTPQDGSGIILTVLIGSLLGAVVGSFVWHNVRPYSGGWD